MKQMDSREPKPNKKPKRTPKVELQPATITLEDTFGAVTPKRRPEDFKKLRKIAIEEHAKEVAYTSKASRRHKSKAEKILNENMIALNKVGEAKGITEEDLLRIGEEIREELFKERYGITQ
jgi:hypothetical protein